MPLRKRILAIFVLAAASAGLGAQTAAFLGHMDRFLEDINKELPDTALSGGTWSNGYIGQLISLPPHLGIGVSCGFSRFPASELEAAASEAGAVIGIPAIMGRGYIPLINPAIELRLGGFKLPFDLGARFSMLSADKLFDVEVKYHSISVDLRYAIIRESVVLPDIVVGIGWYYTAGNIGYGFSPDELGLAGFDTSGMEGAKSLGIEFKTNVFELRAQVSKTLLIFTPYLGLTGYFAMSESSYEIAGARDELSSNHFGSRVYGGLSFNIFMVKIDVSASYNFVTQNWGGNVGARFQL